MLKVKNKFNIIHQKKYQRTFFGEEQPSLKSIKQQSLFDDKVMCCDDGV